MAWRRRLPEDDGGTHRQALRVAYSNAPDLPRSEVKSRCVRAWKRYRQTRATCRTTLEATSPATQSADDRALPRHATSAVCHTDCRDALARRSEVELRSQLLNVGVSGSPLEGVGHLSNGVVRDWRLRMRKQRQVLDLSAAQRDLKLPLIDAGDCARR